MLIIEFVLIVVIRELVTLTRWRGLTWPRTSSSQTLQWRRWLTASWRRTRGLRTTSRHINSKLQSVPCELCELFNDSLY